jgi:hypothetical protein
MGGGEEFKEEKAVSILSRHRLELVFSVNVEVLMIKS